MCIRDSLNTQHCGENECKICGKTSESDICYDCAVFQNISGELVRGGKYIAVTKSPIGGIDWELDVYKRQGICLAGIQL